jgi:hypothetical protein
VQFFGSYSLGRLAQYRIENLERELNKCFVAFSMPSIPPLDATPVATGYTLLTNRPRGPSPASLLVTDTALLCSNWGCGAFGGFHDVKAIIQLMAASATGRPVR